MAKMFESSICPDSFFYTHDAMVHPTNNTIRVS